MYEIQAKIQFIFSKHSQYIRIICHNMDIEFIKKKLLSDDLRSPWNISQIKIAFYAVCIEKRNSNQQYTILQKIKIE